jgi:hypothetical protein
MNAMNPKKAIAAIDRAGALLVFPLGNRKQPASLWSHFFPRTRMRWEWDESGDNRVGLLWQLKGELATTRKVVYTKWFRGRATYFSRPLFTALLRGLNPSDAPPHLSLSLAARRILEILDGESPLSTKELKLQTGLKGRANEAAYERALKELWSKLLIVAYGEVDDGAFPSLAIGSTRVLFESLWRDAFAISANEAETRIMKFLPRDDLFLKHYRKLKLQAPAQSLRERKRGVTGVVSFRDVAT